MRNDLQISDWLKRAKIREFGGSELRLARVGWKTSFTFARMFFKRVFPVFYNLFIGLYVIGIRIASLRNNKAKEWLTGRKNLFEKLETALSPGDRIIWVHCASAGEFEQGKPVIEALKQQYPLHKVLISFFSPSGFAAAKKYTLADFITYLPADTPRNAKRFVQILQPELVIFVKYEFWYHHLAAVAFHHIPLLLVSGIFREEQAFFKWYGSPYRQLLFLFRHLFVQDETSLQLLKSYQVPHCSVGGDTRFDRVKKIAAQASVLEKIESFAGKARVVVAGSTWYEDEALLSQYIWNAELKLIIAPHEIDPAHLQQIEGLFPAAARYSGLEQAAPGLPVLIIDNMGMLSRLYQYATVAYIGGGFNKSGIHNTLEAAVYGRPVIFGPNYQKFKEARELIAKRAAFSIASADQLRSAMDRLLHDRQQLEIAGRASGVYVEENTGATDKVIRFIQENRLLTS